MQVELWNDNKFVHKEKFMGEEITIPAGKCIKLNRDEAVRLMGQYNSPEVDGNGNPLQETMKILRMEEVRGKPAGSKSTERFKCHACSYIGSSQNDLDDHINSNHLDMLDDQKLATERRKGAGQKG